MEAIVKAIVRDERTVMTVSTLLEDYMGVSGVCLSVPTIVGRQGAIRTLNIALSPTERKQFLASAEVIRRAQEATQIDC